MWQAIAAIAAIGLNAYGTKVQYDAQKANQKLAEKRRRDMMARITDRAASASNTMEGPIRGVRTLKQIRNPALAQGYETSRRLKQRGMQMRQAQRRGGVTPEQNRALLLGGDMADYLANKAQAEARVMALTQAEFQMVSHQQQLKAEILKPMDQLAAGFTGQAMESNLAKAQLLAKGAGAMSSAISLAAGAGGEGGDSIAATKGESAGKATPLANQPPKGQHPSGPGGLLKNVWKDSTTGKWMSGPKPKATDTKTAASIGLQFDDLEKLLGLDLSGGGIS